MIVRLNQDKIPMDELLANTCHIRYHGHPKGCPKSCYADDKRMIDEVFELDKEVYAIFTDYSIGVFAERMRLAHPEWKERVFPDNPMISRQIIGSLKDELRVKHPEWKEEYFPNENPPHWKSSRQWYNPRLWQESARNILREEAGKFLSKNPHLLIETCPEKRGVNITGMMYEIGIKLSWQWPPVHDIRNISYIIYLAGHPRS